MTLSSARDGLGYLLATSLDHGIFPALAITFSFFLVRLLLRNYWLSVAVTGILVLLVNLGGENFGVEMPFVVLTTAVVMFALVRLGILAVAVATFISNLWTSFPITVNFSQWYSAQSLFMFAVFLRALFYGFRVALGNKPLLSET